MASLSISKAWDEAKAVLARDGRLIWIVALALIVLPVTILGLVAPTAVASSAPPPAWIRILSLVVAGVGIAGQIAIIRLALGSPVTVGESIAHAFRRLLPVLGAIFLLGILLGVMLVALFLMIAGADSLEAVAAGRITPSAGRAALILFFLVVLISARFQLITPVGSAERGGPIHLIRRSWQLSKGNYWRMLAFVAASLLLAGIIMLFLGQVMGGIFVRAIFADVSAMSFGALLAGLIAGIAQAAFSVVVSTMLARIYLQVSGSVAQPSVPDTGD